MSDCPIIRAYATGLSDRMNDAERQMLRPFAQRMTDNSDRQSESDRMRFIVLESARRIVPLALDKQWPATANNLRLLPNDIPFMKLGDELRHVGTIAVEAGAAADQTAYFIAAAADIAVAKATKAIRTPDKATAAIAIAEAIAYAADRAGKAHKADVAAGRKRVWTEGIWILDNVLKIGKQAGAA